MFLHDPPNELATDTNESSGFIVFRRLPCPSGTTVDFSIDAILGSEYGDMPPSPCGAALLHTSPELPWGGHKPPGWEAYIERRMTRLIPGVDTRRVAPLRTSGIRPPADSGG